VHDFGTVSVLDMQHITLHKITMDRDHVVTALRAVWNGYRNNMPTADIQKVISLDHVLRAVGVEVQLMVLLTFLGLVRAQ